MLSEMKSVVVIGPGDSDEEGVTKFMDWYRTNQSAVADKYVPNAEETRKSLNRMKRERVK